MSENVRSIVDRCARLDFTAMFGIDPALSDAEVVAKRTAWLITHLHPDKRGHEATQGMRSADAKFDALVRLLDASADSSTVYANIVSTCRAIREVSASSDLRVVYALQACTTRLLDAMLRPDTTVSEKLLSVAAVAAQYSRDIDARCTQLTLADVGEDSGARAAGGTKRKREQACSDALEHVSNWARLLPTPSAQELLAGTETTGRTRSSDMWRAGADSDAYNKNAYINTCPLCKKDGAQKERMYKINCSCKQWYHLACLVAFCEGASRKSDRCTIHSIVQLKCPEAPCGMHNSELKHREV